MWGQCPSFCELASANKPSVEFRRNLVHDFSAKSVEHVWFRGSQLTESHTCLIVVSGFIPVISIALDKLW
jgi:hypothetical protein